ncbi:MAG: glycosyltransferase family 39 protein [Dehalococcoidia bacterium]|nr:glycosyltransferase family 39 protein [Dehalococcoidia bacterium]
MSEPQTVRRWHRLLLSGIVIAYIVLGVTYSFVNPLFESPDENWHFAFVKYVVDHRQLPIQPPEKYRHDVAQEASQPPLYYLVGAMATFWIDTADFKEILRSNPSWAYGGPTWHYDNVNRYVHPPDQTFSFVTTALSARLLRWLSVGLGIIAILSTYYVAREVLTGHGSLALGAAAMVAFTPQFIFVNSSVTNDSAVIALSSLSILLLIRSITRGLDRRRAVTLGLVLGLALLAKLSALMLIPLIVAALGIQWFWAKPRQNGHSLYSYWQFLGLCFLIAGALAGWWYARNWWLYGEPTGSAMMQTVFGHRDPTPGLLDLLPELPAVQRSFWAAFGWGNIFVMEPIYQALNLIVGLSLIGLLYGSIRQAWSLSSRHRQPERKTAYGTRLVCFVVFALWCLFVFAALLRWMQSNNASLGRLLLPTIGVASILILYGIGRLTPSRTRPYVYVCLSVLLLLLAITVPFRFIAPAYAYPPTYDMTARPSAQNPTSIIYGDMIELTGYDLEAEDQLSGSTIQNGQPGSVTVSPDVSLKLTLYWRPLKMISEDYTVYVKLVDSSWRLYGQRDTYPGLGRYPTSFWKPGTIVRDVYYVPIIGTVDSSVLASVLVGFYDRKTMAGLPVRRADKPDSESSDVTTVKIVPTSLEPIPNPLNASFGNGITLEGYRLGAEVTQAKNADKTVSGSLENAATGQPPLAVTLYWLVRQKPDKNYTVFVHLLNSQANIVAQQDVMPNNGLYPTSMWDPGDQIVDRHIISLPPGLTSDSYQLRIGMYDAATGIRVNILEGGSAESAILVNVPATIIPGGATAK